MHIGILQTGHVAEALLEHGDYDQIFAEFLTGRGLRLSNYAVVDEVFPDSIHTCDGWLITGSKHGAYEDHPWIPPLEDFIRAAHAACVPMVGICFGHQIIAQALGGRVEKFEGGWAVGAKRYAVEGWGDLVLNAWHQDQVTERPPEARAFASNDFCAYPALAYGDHILTLQPHPEIRKGYMQGLIDVRGPGVVPQPLLDAAARDLDQPLDEALVADRIAEFFKTARQTHV
jgi:GMP synthase (glutamine-hydrolysing)